MPTPVDSARACVAGDAARALDDSVAVARRRSHAQTTSLHVISALVSPSFPGPLLRDALARARSAGYSSRLQFKALELCFGVALDRLPSAHPPPPEPPISNSLMAAIKRSQANQRRNPDTFHLYSGAGIGATPVAGVKVELQQMVLAILDDPVVSRVFGEAGFRSCDIKLAVLRPPPPILRFPRAARCPPLFLCNFDAASFPFPLSSPTAGDENCRRIGEIVAKKSARNPILVGVAAEDAAEAFVRAVEQQSSGVVPTELHGVKVVGIEDWNGGEVEALVRGAEEKAAGLLVSVGDLKGMVESENTSGMVAELTRVMVAGKGKVWVMGWSATYEMYMKLLSKYPSLDKDWDLQLLPITWVKNASCGMLTRPQSLMESFVPFGGFFPLAYEPKCLPSGPYQSALRCHLCNEMYEREVAAIAKGCSAPVEDQHQASSPAWLQNSEAVVLNKGLDGMKAKDDKELLNTKVVDLQKKWNDNCQRLHRGFQLLEANDYQLAPHFVGLQYLANKEGSGALGNQNPGVNEKQSTLANAFPVSECLEISAACSTVPLPAVAESKTNLSEFEVRLSKSEQLQTEVFQPHPGVSDLGTCDDLASPSSVTSVRTDLVLGTPKAPSTEVNCASGTQASSLPDLSGSLPTKKVDISGRSIPKVRVQSHSSCCSSNSLVKGTATGSHHLSLIEKGCQNAANLSEYSEPKNYKAFLRSIVDKVGRQEEAICTISQAILHCKAAPERFRGAGLKGDIWLSFHGPDKVGKQKIALALSELWFGSRENLIQLDLSLHDGIACSNAICDMLESNNYAMQFRGKTIADQIVAELSKKPCSVIFLENVDKADLLVQNSLSQAIRTGKLSDSHGRQISINNAIFITTTKEVRGGTSFSPSKECVNFLEERILAAQAWKMKILIEPLAEALSTVPYTNTLVSRKETAGRKTTSCLALASKRKLDPADGHRDQHGSLSCLKRANRSSNTFLDLNLPVEEMVIDDANSSNSDGNHKISDNSDAWLEEFLELMDERVNFKPFDFDSLAASILNKIKKRFHQTVGSESILEIDVKAMAQILAATWLLEDRKALQNWIDQVLCRSFTEVRWRCNGSNPTVFRLVVCQDVLTQEQAPGIRLPSRISIN